MHTLLLKEKDQSVSYKTFYMILLTGYFILKPFYTFQSGLPQFSDFLLLLMAFVSILSLRKEAIHRNSLILWGSVFFYYSILVNVLWGIILGGQLELVGNSLFYLFNLVIMVVFLNIAGKIGKPAFMNFVFYGTACSVLIQCMLIPFFIQLNGIRTTLMFNNPNQLGYFGLLSLALLLVTAQNLKVRPGLFFLSIVASLALILISLSKAAIISGLITVFLFLVIKNRREDGSAKTKVFLMVLIGLLLSSFLLNAKSIVQSQIVQDVVYRMNSIGHDRDDSLSGRGYDRVTNYPYYIFLGAGEGLFERFQEHKEMHSTVGNILFSYGIIGLTLFAIFLYQAVSRLKFAQTYPLYTVLLFGLTHNGIRHTYLWLLLVLFYISKTQTEKSDLLP